MKRILPRNSVIGTVSLPPSSKHYSAAHCNKESHDIFYMCVQWYPAATDRKMYKNLYFSVEKYQQFQYWFYSVADATAKYCEKSTCTENRSAVCLLSRCDCTGWRKNRRSLAGLNETLVISQNSDRVLFFFFVLILSSSFVTKVSHKRHGSVRDFVNCFAPFWLKILRVNFVWSYYPVFFYCACRPTFVSLL